MKLTVVIPVYRTEYTLNRCVQSVLGQDYPHLEVILVDDGSPDGSPVLCDEWAAKDSRIRVVHKENGGLSDARNAGISIASGDYVTFVDSDDFISKGTYRPLMEHITKNPDIDILEYPIYVHYGSTRQHIVGFQPEAVYHDMEAYWLDGQAYQHTYACNKIFRKSLFDHVRFPVGKVFEDALTLPLLLKEARTVQTASQGLYYYCSNSQGITQTADGQALRMLLEPHAAIITQIQRRDKVFQTYYLHVLNIQMDVCERTGEPPVLTQVKVNPSYFSGVPKLKASLLNSLGINKLCTLNKLVHKIWRNR